MAFVAIFGDFIANERPLFAHFEGRNYFPAFRGVGVDHFGLGWPEGMTQDRWHDRTYNAVLFPPIPWSAQSPDQKTTLAPPLRKMEAGGRTFRHWLGTDNIGRDVAAGMVRGTRIAFFVGLGSMFVAACLGMLLGGAAGYFGDRGLRFSALQGAMLVAGALIVAFYLLALPLQLNPQASWLRMGMIGLGMILGLAGLILPEGKKGPGPRWFFPLDAIVLRLIEIFNSFPALLLLIALITLVEQAGYIYLALLIGVLSWTSIARFARAEMLRIRELGYVRSARALGFTEPYILFRHAMPNALRPVFIMLAFGLAGSILLESYLSFLGIGLPPDKVSWGSMLQNARGRYMAWWLAVFPGIGIFLSILLFNVIGDDLSERK